MKSKFLHRYKKHISSQSVLIIIVVAVIGVIVFQIYRIYSFEQRQAKYRLILPPNGTTLFQPSPTPTPIPRKVGPGQYTNDELGISLVIPTSYSGLETSAADGRRKLKIYQDTNPDFSMSMSKGKKIRGYGGGDEYVCTSVAIDGIALTMPNNDVAKRCMHVETDAVVYDMMLMYPEENNPYALIITYDFIKLPKTDEFSGFDKILSTLKFLTSQ